MDGFEIWNNGTGFRIGLFIGHVQQVYTEDQFRMFARRIEAAEAELNRRVAAGYPTEDDGEMG